MATIFSRIIRGEIPSYRIAEDDRYYAFLDINPVQRAHVLVVPKEEQDYIFDLCDNELSGIILFARQVACAIRTATQCSKVGMAVVGLEVDHAHIHLIPLNKADDMDFSHKLTLSNNELATIAQEIRLHLPQSLL